MTILESQPIGMPEAKKILEAKEKKGELGYEQKLASDHLKRFTKLKPEQAAKISKEIGEVIRVDPETMSQILNLVPKNPDELRLVFAREKFSLKEEELTKVLEIVKNNS